MERLVLPPAYIARLLNRFLRYVTVNTQSNGRAPEGCCPTTPGQYELATMLADELAACGAVDVRLADNGYVYATVPSNLPANHPARAKLPVIGLMSHLDTAAEAPGQDVRPRVVQDYDGSDLGYPDDPHLKLTVAENPELACCLGHTLVTASGQTLLGADDKAGLAEIMTVVEYLSREGVPHGEIRVCFNPDEEIGRGTDHIDLAKFPVQCAYTVDGGTLGEIEDECFNAATAEITITGKSVHPGYAKGKMVNAYRVLARIIDRLPEEALPENTDGRAPYRFPYALTSKEPSPGNVSFAFLLRAFTEKELTEMEVGLRRLCREAEEQFPGATVEVKVKQQYRNMKSVLDQHPLVMEVLEAACRQQGVATIKKPIRGGTDGSALSINHGIPTPNIWTGAMNMHGQREWISLRWMTSAVETVLATLALWVERCSS